MNAIQTGKAYTEKKTFSRETSVSIDIQSDPAIIWKLLTTAPDYPRWNPTVVSMEGVIEQGAGIRLRSSLDPKRVFKLRVKELEPGRKLSWGDAMGTRVFTLSDNGSGHTRFSMQEKIGGPMFPLFAKYIPSFDASFEAFAASLKKESELIQNLGK